MKSLIKRHPIMTYFLLVFLISYYKVSVFCGHPDMGTQNQIVPFR